MALQALHEHYWPGDGVGPEPPPPGNPGYSCWQAGVTASVLLLTAWLHPPSAFVFATMLPLRPRPWPKWLRRLGRRIERAVPERLWVLWRLVRLVLFSSEYAKARAAVRVVAVSGLSKKKAWNLVGQRMADRPGLAENVYRAMHAIELYGAVEHKQGHTRSLLLEVAYTALKERGK